MRVYLVGGAVRDRLLDLPVVEKDWVVVGAVPEQLLSQGYRQVGADFPVFLHPDTGEEYALARTERKSGKGYHGFEVVSTNAVTLEEDLLRRDLTINAMAMGEDQRIIDPYQGLADLEQKWLRHVSPAFAEDPLRVLRVARFASRFASLGFRIAPETLALMRTMAESGELSALTPERVWAETVKALKTQTSEVYFEVLRSVGALSVLFPALDRLFAVPQSVEHHPEGDAGTHTLLVLLAMRQETTDIGCLWAAICHDLGKGVTPEHLLPRHPDHELAGVPLVVALNRHYKVPSSVADFSALVTQWHGHIHRVDALSAQERLAVLNAVDVWRKPDRFEQILKVCRADARGRLGYEQDTYPQVARWQSLMHRTRDISVSALIEQGFSGKALGNQIDQLRLELVMDA